MAEHSLRRRSLFAIFLTIFLDLVGFGMFIPVLITVAKELGAGAAEAASINTWYSVGTLLSVFFLGRMSDRIGRKKLLIATIAVSAVAHLATGYSNNFFLLLAVRFLAGAAAGNISIAQACIADITAPKRRASAMALIGIAFGGGFAVGPALGAVISRFAGSDFMPAIGWTAFALNVINLVFVSKFLIETHPRFASAEMQREKLDDGDTTTAAATAASMVGRGAESRPGSTIISDFMVLARSPALRVTFLMQFLQIFGFVGLETILPLVLMDSYHFGTTQTYDAFVVLGISVLLINGFISRPLLNHMDERIGVKIGQLCLCIGIGGIHLFAPWSGGLYLMLIVVACGTSFTNPSVSSLTSKLCPPEQLGMSFGALQVVGAGARILGPISMGLLYHAAGGSRSLWVTVSLIGLASLASFFIPKPHVHAQTPH
jgi:DHA1 family tetracycline resistance protein-like MFS transporter